MTYAMSHVPRVSVTQQYEMPRGNARRQEPFPQSRTHAGMNVVFALSHQTGIRLAEIGFLLILIAGVWLAAAEILDPDKWGKTRTIVAGVLLAIAGLLLIVATHWGRFA